MVDGWEKWRIHTRWFTKNNCWRMRPVKDYPYQKCAKQMLIDDTNEGIHTRWRMNQLLMEETNEGLPWRTTHSRWCAKQLLKDETDEGIHTKYQMTYETTVGGWHQWRITRARWCTKQLLIDETEESTSDNARNTYLWMRTVNEGLPIPDDRYAGELLEMSQISQVLTHHVVKRLVCQIGWVLSWIDLPFVSSLPILVGQ